MGIKGQKTAEMAFTKKNARAITKGTFTRARSTLTSHIRNSMEESITLAAKGYFDECYLKLEKAHGNYLVAAQINIKES